MKIMKSRRAQVAIFVIIALIIVVGILLAFNLSKPFRTRTIIERPQDYISSCIEDSLTEIEEKVLETNGYPDQNITNFILYRYQKVPYLCTVSEFYAACIPQEPNLVRKIGQSIETSIEPEIDACFQTLVEEYKKQGYEVSENETEINIEFESDTIVTNINKDLFLKKEDAVTSYKTFRAKIQSPIYQLFNTAEVIVNSESAFCEFDEIRWMRDYPDIYISRFRASDQTKVYTIRDRTSEKEIKIAIKTCLLPAGL